MAKKIADVNAQIKAGTADSGDMFEAIAGGLPVIGEFWKAGREIREAFTGDKAEIDEANKALKQMGDTIAVIKKIKLDELGYEISVTKEIEKQLYLRSLIGLSPEDRKKAEASHAAESTVNKADDKFETKKRGRKKDLGGRKKNQKKIDNLKRKNNEKKKAYPRALVARGEKKAIID